MRIFGDIPGVSSGDEFSNRAELAKAGVHLPNVKGISGSRNEGADSIVLSGGYEDDEDFGDVIIYTGAGGQASNKQVSDQKLDGVNLALAKNKIERLPVRVTRGFSHKHELSPAAGYRYAGLYYVDSYWCEKGKSGFLVWRYRLVSFAKNDADVLVVDSQAEYTLPNRTKSTVNRIVRDYQRALNVKKWHDYQCQICGLAIKTSAGWYAEAAHIQPLGEPHNGPDDESNMLCLCPNHHVMFDNGVFTISSVLEVIGIEGKFRLHSKHHINKQFFEYHAKHFFGSGPR